MATYQIGDDSRALIHAALKAYAARCETEAASIDGDESPEAVDAALALAERAATLAEEFEPGV